MVSSPPSRAADRNWVSNNISPGRHFYKKQIPCHPPSTTTQREEGSTQPCKPIYIQPEGFLEPSPTTPWLQQTVSPSCPSAHHSQILGCGCSWSGEQQERAGGKPKAMGAGKLWLPYVALNSTLAKRAIHTSLTLRRTCVE